MQLKLTLALLPLGSWLLPAWAGETTPLEPGGLRPGLLTMKLAAYQQNDSGGIEEVDEDASVFETIILAEQQLTETGTLNLRLLGDVVSAASIERAHNASWQAQQGGASGNYRIGFGAGWSERGDNLDWQVGVQAATEYAYTSLGVSAGLSYTLPGRNTTFSLGAQAYADTVQLIRFDGSDEGDDNRDTITVDLGWQQILTSTDVISVVLSHTQQNGFLATSYNSVFPASGETSEELPDSRARTSLTGRWRHSFGEDSAGEVGLRYYNDDWEVSAITLDLRGSFYLLDRKLLLEPTYRLHVQDGSEHYREHWADPVPSYRTSDPDLGDFTGHMLGVQATVFGGTLFGQPYTWDVSAAVYDRDNGLTMYWLTFGQTIEW